MLLLKKGDFIWGLTLIAIAMFILMPVTHVIFVDFTTTHPYIGGFIKFGILATMGELLAIRITSGDWKKPSGLIFRAIVWGFLGIVITLMFQIFGGGIMAALEKGYLPGKGSSFAFAFFVSSIMNLTFAPTFMAFHRFTDTYIDMAYEGIKNIKVVDVVGRIDWKGFVSFVIIKTIPLFWIPAHTATFMLPPEYRVITAAFLSVALGVLLAFGKRGSKK